ncbi:MAG: cation-translocating P-type ATPase [Deltaproteobacteria bacterium]|nr:cation-translocating P-type ATPase [Deltaproteobacteria bacterium]
MPSADSSRWHARPLADVERALGTDRRAGLSRDEAARRLGQGGANELRVARGRSAVEIAADQARSLVVWLLVAAGLVSLALGERVDGAAILAIVAVNALIGFAQELRAERAVAALAKLTAPRARVVRDGRSELIPAREVVVGDLLVLDAGDIAAADARLCEASRLQLNEAPLTGESEPVAKHAAELAADTPLPDRRNLVFLGTSVAAGSGRALVVATGMTTEVGRIAQLLESAQTEPTPLQRRLDRVGRQLVWASLAVVAVVSALGWLRGAPPFELFIGAVSLAVAAVPEGLLAVVTVALALGVERMARRRALVRRLASVETLGSTGVICTDKTGTLTVGQMTVRRLATADATLRVTGEGMRAEGEIAGAGADEAAVRALLWAAAACNDAEIVRRDGTYQGTGDTTEIALLVAAAKGGVQRAEIEAQEPRLRTLPFDSERKRMSIVRKRAGREVAYVKGAPEAVLECCTHFAQASGVTAFDAATRAALAQSVAALAADALRVLAIAAREVSGGKPDDEVERGLTLLGFVGMQDPPRPEAASAIARCRSAGIRVVMITGDHPATARAIAAELGIVNASDEVLTGTELERLSHDALRERAPRISVYARTSPEQKLQIVRAWKARGAIVAMTGDGVNDAPALREASIGVAMGAAGTEVAKQAADLVIADDDFASIVAAVEEGRGIFDNVSKTLAYLLAGNVGELGFMLAAGLLGWPVPLLPVQLLWINLVTDGLPALALASDPIDPDVLQRPPRPATAQLADAAGLRTLLLTGALTAAVALAAFGYELARGAELSVARNAAFSTLVFAELLRAFGARSATRSVFEVSLRSNLRLLAVVAASFALQLVIHHEPRVASVFATAPISLGQCVAQIALASVPLALLELRKLALRRTRRKEAS